MAEPTTDLRKQLAQAFSKTATAKGARLGRLRFNLADAALDVFDDDARQKLADDLMEATRIRSMNIRNGGFDMDIDAAREITALYVAAARTMPRRVWSAPGPCGPLSSAGGGTRTGRGGDRARAPSVTRPGQPCGRIGA